MLGDMSSLSSLTGFGSFGGVLVLFFGLLLMVCGRCSWWWGIWVVDLWSGVCGFADGRWLVVAGVKLVEMVGSLGELLLATVAVADGAFGVLGFQD